MKRYYISHPFTGCEGENRDDAERIRAELKKNYPDICFINPLGMFGGRETDYYIALADAMELLSCCEVMILCPDGIIPLAAERKRHLPSSRASRFTI